MALLLSQCLSAMAQNVLRTDGVFAENGIVETVIKSSHVEGRSLDPYNLDTFLSICFEADSATRGTVELWINEDAKKASDTDIEREDGHLTYALLRFPGSTPRKNEYLGYQIKTVDGEYRITVVKMSGKATVKDLKSFFKNK